MADDLPNELLQRISHLCCTDDGAAGCVLSLVSKRWYINSRNAALQTVALRQAKQIVAFSKMIDMLSPQARTEFKLKQLFVHCPNSDYDYTDSEDDENYEDREDDEDDVGATTISGDEGSEYDSGASTSSRDSDYEFLDLGEPDQFREEVIELQLERSVELTSPTFDHYQYRLVVDPSPSVVFEAFSHILSSASSSLVILSVHWASKYGLLLADLLPPLPHLQELHLGLHFIGKWTSNEPALPPPRDLLPQLRRLHFLGPVTYTNLGGTMDELAPYLIQLRIPSQWV